MPLRIIMLGDIVGTVGRQAVAQAVPRLRERYQPDLILANAENCAGGSGLMPDHYQRLMAAGLDGLTLGDHVYRRVQIVATLETVDNLIRPANLPAGAKGRRWMCLRPKAHDGNSALARDSVRPAVYVFTVLGRVFSNMPSDEPFAVIEDVLRQLPEKDPIVILEVHAEATSEKQAIGWYLDGRVAAVLGTHTHVATADARVLPKGTAYITDMGMCGPYESVIGRRIDRVLTQMVTGMPAPFDVAEGDLRVSGVVVDIDPARRLALNIERFEIKADLSAPPFVAGRNREGGEAPAANGG